MSVNLAKSWRNILATLCFVVLAVFAAREVQASEQAISRGANHPCPVDNPEWPELCDEGCDSRCKLEFGNDWVGGCDLWQGMVPCCHCVFQAQ